MTAPEVYEIYYMTMGTMDQIFEFWLTASFSVVIAAFFLSHKMNRFIFLLLFGGYTLFSIGLGVRYVIASTTLVSMRDQLIDMGEPFSALMSTGAGVFVALTCLFGFFGTLGYLCYSYFSLRST